MLTLGASTSRVVGIVEDGRHDPRVYRPVGAITASTVTFLVRTDRPAAASLGRLRAAPAPALPSGTQPIVATWRDANMRGLDQISRVGAMLGGLALLLAGAGIYGSMAFHGRQRMREIAVRRTLGATSPAIARLVAADAGRVTVVGIGLGLALGWLGTQGLFALLGGPAWFVDWTAAAAVAAIFALTIAAASAAPAWRAIRLQPSRVLHTD